MALAFDQLPAVVIRERVWIPRDLVISEDKLRADLTISNGAYHAAQRRGFAVPENVPEEFILYEETDGFFIVPRAYSLPLKGKRDVDYRVVDLTGRRGKISGEDRVGLGPNEWQPFDQGPGFATLAAPDVAPHGRMFVLRCGGGKTAISLKAAHARGGRTLWVTITDVLLDQARDDIERWLGIDKRRIGWVQGAKQRWRGCGIAVATLQTLTLSETLPSQFWDYWDLVIFDEGDVLGAPSFHKVVPKFRAERWVLTATPKRVDNNDALFLLNTGPVCYQHTEFDLEPECYFIPTLADESLLATMGWDRFKHAPRPQFAVTAKNLLLDPARQQLVLSEVQKALAKDRTILVVGDSIEGIAILRQRAADLNIECSVITSETKRGVRKDAIKIPPVVFATSGIFRRGIDRVAFDTLIIASLTTVNETFTNQLAGRILRSNKDDPDKRPVIVVPTDIKIDPLRMMTGRLAERFASYGWKVGGIGPKLIAEMSARKRGR